MNRDRATSSRVGRSDQQDTVGGRVTRTLVMDERKTLTVVEAANILGIGRNTAYELYPLPVRLFYGDANGDGMMELAEAFADTKTK